MGERKREYQKTSKVKHTLVLTRAQLNKPGSFTNVTTFSGKHNTFPEQAHACPSDVGVVCFLERHS